MERSEGKDLGDFTDQSSSSFSDAALSDASQYTFFGKGVVDEVELGGFEDEDESAPGVEGRICGEDDLNEYHLFDKDEVEGERTYHERVATILGNIEIEVVSEKQRKKAAPPVTPLNHTSDKTKVLSS